MCTGLVRLVGARTASARSIKAIKSPAAITASHRGIQTEFLNFAMDSNLTLEPEVFPSLVSHPGLLGTTKRGVVLGM